MHDHEEELSEDLAAGSESMSTPRHFVEFFPFSLPNSKMEFSYITSFPPPINPETQFAFPPL